MTFEFQPPVSLPRFTKDEFLKQRRAYTAVHGYTINIPKFEDIVKFGFHDEPTELELHLYLKKDVKALGEIRYNEILAIMVKKRENFMRLLSSATPSIFNNASSILTTLDDVNDTLGTFAFIAAVTARLLPKTAAKALLGPAGWALLGADIANLALKLSTMPFKAKRLQHELNDMAKGNPLSKKARIKRARKLRKLNPSPGVIIEALQTTENMFGMGLSLGPLMGLVWEVPAGLARHVSGQKVTVRNLPPPVEYIEGVWSGMLKAAAVLWTGVVPLDDEELTKSIIATNMASQVAHSYLAQVSPIDALDIIHDIQIKAPTPHHPSTLQVIKEEIIDPSKNIGWVHNDLVFGTAEKIWHSIYDPVIENVSNWMGRNKHSQEGYIAGQNMIDAGLNIMGSIEGDDAIELDYEPFTAVMLKLMNLNYRFPPGATQEHVQCFRKMVEEATERDGYIDQIDARYRAERECGFSFTTFVPERPTPTEEELSTKAENTIERLREWYVKKVLINWFLSVRWVKDNLYVSYVTTMKHLQARVDWLDYYQWPERGLAYWFEKDNPINQKVMTSMHLFPEVPKTYPIAYSPTVLMAFHDKRIKITRLNVRPPQ